MRLEGIHHVTAITGDAPGNVDFYVRVLGLRLVKKTVNQDDPTVYHLFYADERGSAGRRHHVLRVPGRAARARRARAWCTASSSGSRSEEALDFWAERLREEGVASRARREPHFTDPEGLGLELAVVETDDEPLTAEHPEIPAEHRIQGFDRVRAYTRDPEASRSFLEEALEFEQSGDDRLRGARRAARRALRLRHDGPGGHPGRRAPSTTSPGPRRTRSTRRGASAWSKAGGRPTPVIDRFYFKSIYFREPSGVLFEIATHRPRLHDRRAARDPRRAPLAPAGLRAPARAGRARADADHEPARQLGAALSLESRTRPAAGEPEGALVLFHGRGTDENDLFPLLDALDPRAATARRHSARAALAAARRPRTGTSSASSAIRPRTHSCPRSARRRAFSTDSRPRRGSRPSEPCSAASRRAR